MTTMITDRAAGPAVGTTITNPIGVTPVAVGTMTSATMTAVRVAGSVTPGAMRKPRDVGGNVPTTAKADGLAIAKASRPHVAAGSAPTMATAAGTATRRPFGSGPPRLGRGHRSQRRDDDDERQGGSSRRDDEYRSRSRQDDDRRCESEAVPADDDDRPLFFGRPRTWRLVGRPRGSLKRHAAVGEGKPSVIETTYPLSVSKVAPGLGQGPQWRSRHADNRSKGLRRAVLRHPQGHLLRREANSSRAAKNGEECFLWR